MSFLVEYSSSDSDNEENNLLRENSNTSAAGNCPEGRKKKHTLHEILENTKKRLKTGESGRDGESTKLLPAPSGVLSMFSNDSVHFDDPSLHDGRTRSFPHERGNWAGHIYFPVELCEAWTALVDSLINKLQPRYTFEKFPELHLSFSKCFVVRHHWIDEFVSTLRKNLAHTDKFLVDFKNLRIFSNDEKTRSFLVLEVSTGVGHIKKLVKQIDSSLEEYNLPQYYKDPSFHISLCWTLGDVACDISQTTLDTLQAYCDKWLEEHDDLSSLVVDKVVCKLGNKYFNVAFH